jgi:hypothetical protein
VDEIFEIYRPLFSGSPWDFLFVAVKYLMSVSPPPLPRERLRAAVAKVFAEQEGAIMQTLAEEWKQEMREEAMVEFRQKWEPQLRQEERQEEAATFALLLLYKHLGALDASTEKRVRALSVAQLEELGLAASDFRTSKDLLAWLRAQSHTGKE